MRRGPWRLRWPSTGVGWLVPRWAPGNRDMWDDFAFIYLLIKRDLSVHSLRPRLDRRLRRPRQGPGQEEPIVLWNSPGLRLPQRDPGTQEDGSIGDHVFWGLGHGIAQCEDPKVPLPYFPWARPGFYSLARGTGGRGSSHPIGWLRPSNSTGHIWGVGAAGSPDKVEERPHSSSTSLNAPRLPGWIVRATGLCKGGPG